MKPSTSFPSNEVEGLFAQAQAGIITASIVFCAVVGYLLYKYYNKKTSKRRINKLTMTHTMEN